MTSADIWRSRATLTAKVLVFDLDGTLIDSGPIVRRVWSEWATRQDLDPEAVTSASRGRRTRDIVKRLLRESDLVSQEVAYLDQQEQDASWEIPPVKGALTLLATLPPGKWGIVTSSSRQSAEVRLVACGLPSPMILLTGDEVVAGKPNPEGYLSAARRFGVLPQEMIVFEDSEVGAAASAAAGATTIGISSTGGSCGLGAEWTIKDFLSVSVDLIEGGLSIVLRDALERIVA